MTITRLMLKKDDFIISVIYWIWNLKQFFKISLWGIKSRMRKIKAIGDGQDLYIVLNGPSLKNQDLKKLKGKNVMFVNRGFMHEDYAEIQPKFHVFIDSKIRDGIWPIEWIEKIFEKSPGITIILPIEWYNHPTFKNYKNDPRIYWMYWQLPFHNLAVSGGCFSFAIKQKFQNIYFTGFDGNGLFYELLRDSNSHFYGEDPELKGKTTENYAEDLYSHSRHFHDLGRLSVYCKKRGINITNLTEGGLLDMFPRKNFNEII